MIDVSTSRSTFLTNRQTMNSSTTLRQIPRIFGLQPYTYVSQLNTVEQKFHELKTNLARKSHLNRNSRVFSGNQRRDKILKHVRGDRKALDLKQEMSSKINAIHEFEKIKIFKNKNSTLLQLTDDEFKPVITSS